MPKSPEEMAKSMIANMPEKTGKPLTDWLEIAGASGQEKHGQIVKHLKTEHGLTHGYANLVANQYLNPTTVKADDLVTTQYAGDKAVLLPIYQLVIDFVATLGNDVEISPKKANVSLRRSKQFGLIQPSTKTRVDLGINLIGVEPEGALEASVSFNKMVSHRVRLASEKDFDKKVKAWLKQAYENA